MREPTRVVKAYEDAINANRIVGSQCNACQDIEVPPRPVCRKCGSSDIDITTVNARGQLLTWTVIHIAPPSYLDKAPYTLAIVEMESGQRLSGILDFPEGVEPEFGQKVVAGFEEGIEGTSRLRWRLA